MKISKSLLLAAATGLAASSAANAVVLADADFDTYSYVFMGTNNTGAPTVNVSQYSGAGHFTFGVISFDVSELSVSGDKYLSLQASGYPDGSMGPGSVPIGTGTVNVGVLGESYSDYLDSGDKLAWFNSNVLTLTPVGEMTFTNGGVSSMDVTSSVNDWIDSGSSNYGFVFWTTDNAGVQIVSSDATSGYTPALTSSAVPEPETFGAIAGALALGLAVCRRRTSKS
ncbi:hypothetical protein [Puniceicoccus vermicola]|uniref:PEP-CTERM sorting domain-containing protein n=1 Tax=Puniceicoccus vermicola TaxID=388746 RepID=A0A7X1AZ50_9BACT|nr:hypothetical protein [Puniceicoccus vermicola]MBC2601515.1 hypothetical protein [Puniceicoccus vermicola]